MIHAAAERLAYARASLEGLSVGDALGGFFEGSRPGSLPHYVKQRQPPAARPWHFTDDTNMALSIYSTLRQREQIDQDVLARGFGLHFDRSRGYGLGAINLLKQIRAGYSWRIGVREMFGGTGSFGNGAAMRVAPLGAYFADDLGKVVEQAHLASEVTHAHPEGIAGGIAVAVAAAVAQNLRGQPAPSRAEFIDRVLPYLPVESEVWTTVRRARDLPANSSLDFVISVLGNGDRVTAQDTVGYCLWCAGEKLTHYEDALWVTMSGGGDVDTNCAIVGGIVTCYTGAEAIPQAWIEAREPLPDWAFTETL
jgi:ADP-ribosylglycohydrolase